MSASGTAFGRYELRGELGWGGFATVYRAWDPALEREVAVKALLPHLAREPDIRQRFLHEARALARLQHPHIVAVYDVGEAEDRPYFAMALVDGRTLAEILAASHHLSLPRVLSLLSGLGSALDELHAHAIVHRDLKPQNVMVDRSDRVVLMDLGIARSLDTTGLTRTGYTVGTAAYMAPEQVSGRPVGPAADIYALGVLTYQLLADRPPFTGDTATVLYAQVNEPPPPLAELRPGLPESVYHAIEAALSKDPDQRPPSARRFGELLSGEATLPVANAITAPLVEAGAAPGRTEPLRTFSAAPAAPAVTIPPAPGQGTASPRRRGRLLGAAAAALLLLAGGSALVFGRNSPPRQDSAVPPAVVAGEVTVGAQQSPTPSARAPLALEPPSQTCTPKAAAPRGQIACSIFLNNDVTDGVSIKVSPRGPAGVAILGCHSESGGLACSPSSSRLATVTCGETVCRTGAQFTADISATAAGPLLDTITITAPGGQQRMFSIPTGARFGP